MHPLGGFNSTVTVQADPYFRSAPSGISLTLFDSQYTLLTPQVGVRVSSSLRVAENHQRPQLGRYAYIQRNVKFLVTNPLQVHVCRYLPGPLFVKLIQNFTICNLESIVFI